MNDAGGPGRLGYRPALDGVRAFAIVAVMGTHIHATLLPGGGLGVDVFFALSGFLITTLILEELGSSGSGGYGFKRFYIRRALRLFPALYAAILVVGIYFVLRWDEIPGFLAATTLSGPASRDLYVKHLVLAATYTTNLFGFPWTQRNLFGHTWSLGVEEQFYIVWPLLLVTIARKRSLALLTGLLAGFIVLCLPLRVVLGETDHGFLWMRPEAIAAGALAALLRWQGGPIPRLVARWSSFLVVAGGVVLVTCIVLAGRSLSLEMFAHGGNTAFGVVAALTVWAVVEIGPSHLVRRTLELRPVVYVGILSYSLYIWHLPVYRIVRWEAGGQSASAIFVLKLVVSFAAAWVSYRFIERPFRTMQHRFRRVEVEAGDRAAGLPAAVGGGADES